MDFITFPLVELVGRTGFIYKPLASNSDWQPRMTRDGEQLVEFGGRACYRSWNNPSGRPRDAYIANILEHEHFSVLEHAVLSFWIEGISRACSHELVRHRHLSFSMESQRYVPASDINFVLPPSIIGDATLEQIFKDGCHKALDSYETLLEHLQRKFDSIPDVRLKRKLVREAARSMLPNAAETRLLVTGNARSWREFIQKRATIHADAEMCRLAVAIFAILKVELPAIFQDMALDRATIHDLNREIVVSA